MKGFQQIAFQQVAEQENFLADFAHSIEGMQCIIQIHAVEAMQCITHKLPAITLF